VKYQIGKNGFPVDRFAAVQVVGDNGSVWTLKSKEIVLENTPDPHQADCSL